MATRITALLALVSLVTCLLVPILYFAGRVGFESYKTAFLIASIVWFVAATWWATRKHREKQEAHPG